ncbi:TadE/TadG family type IV pilus assembly protein (plasmid) [Geminicoccaceae bacterium 1502E]|nr:TadE/TadG family type IV pilus assembly protein [Geminicoccaceae bacterium 1502E]
MAALEFALTLPVLLMLLLGAVDAVILLRSSMRIDRSAAEVANLVSQYTALREADFPGIFDAARRIAEPLVVSGAEGAMIITVIANDGRQTTIAWQRRAGAPEIRSEIGASGKPRLPAGLELDDGQTAVLVEAFSTIVPFALSGRLLFGDISPVTLRGFAVFRPRVATLATVGT